MAGEVRSCAIMCGEMRPTGTGPGVITADGCAVDLYAMLPPHGEAELIHAAVREGASILELGCGTGRITRGLLVLGHTVTGVDFSAEMLAHMPTGARQVLSDIESLRLDERFGAVTLTSNMVSGPRPQALGFLRTAAAHLAPGGVVVIERLHPRWASTEALEDVAAPRTRGDLTGSLEDIALDGDVTTMTIRYAHADGRVWTQHASMHAWSDSELQSMLASTGLRRVRCLDPDEDWVLATAAGSAG
jgi:SAM-dependent methyltransferase